MRLLHLIFTLFLFTQVNAQCENVNIKEDKFEKTKKFNTKKSLNLSEVIGVSIRKNHNLVTISCFVGDSLGNGYKVGVNAGLIFLFTDGSTLKLYNECLKATSDEPRISNELGCIQIDLFDSQIMKTDWNILNQLSTKKIESIRVMDVQGNNWDFDLTLDEQSYFENAISCMIN